ncbi:hypothetical protein WG899_09175 [Paucibacter sp. AS339]|uniref:hypothetical protein n=1 Tax=Paucibacter hankyongi TaxID=3133434 RepID=UPI0030A0CA29
MRLVLGGYMQELAQPATFDVYFYQASGKDHRAYAFKLKQAVGTWAAGTPVLIVKRDKDGSAQGVTPLVNANATLTPGVDGDGANQFHMLVDSNCTAAPGGVSPAVDVQSAGFICNATQQRFAHVGMSDVEPAMIQQPINGGSSLSTASLNANSVAQGIFGVAVSKSLYLALQKAQGLVDISASGIDEDATKQPSIPAGFVRTALTGKASGSLSTLVGWNILIPSSVDAAVNTKQVNVCRRTANSGTQAASNMYFAANPCAGADNYIPSTGTKVGSVLGTVDQVIKKDGRTGYFEGSSTQVVESCLGTTAEGLGAYALGIIGRENNPRPTVNGVKQDKGYRFVKLNGVAPERANVIDTSYDFVFEASMQWRDSGVNAPAADVLAFITDMRNNMGKASVLQKLDGDLQAGLVATPNSYAGAWANLSADDKLFSARASRVKSNSCTPIRMSK